MSKKDKLFEKIESLGYPENEILVTLDDFFEGNNDSASIGVNIYPHQPPPSYFYSKFKEISQLDSVDNIYVRIADTEDGNWAYTDVVYIITTLAKVDLQQLLTDLQPDEIYEDWMYDKPINAPELTNNFKVYSIWWD